MWKVRGPNLCYVSIPCSKPLNKKSEYHYIISLASQSITFIQGTTKLIEFSTYQSFQMKGYKIHFLLNTSELQLITHQKLNKTKQKQKQENKHKTNQLQANIIMIISAGLTLRFKSTGKKLITCPFLHIFLLKTKHFLPAVIE